MLFCVDLNTGFCCELCYIPRHKLVVSAWFDTVVGFDSENGTLRWDSEGWDTKHGIAYSSEHDAVLVPNIDGDARDGELRQELRLPRGVGSGMVKLQLHDDKLVVLHRDPEGSVSFYSLQYM